MCNIKEKNMCIICVCVNVLAVTTIIIYKYIDSNHHSCTLTKGEMKKKKKKTKKTKLNSDVFFYMRLARLPIAAPFFVLPVEEMTI